MKLQQTSDGYQEQLQRWVGALTTGDLREMYDALSEGEAGDVRRFLDNGVGERRKLLRQELAFVALAFDDFEDLVSDYVRSMPQTAYDPARSDREQFLCWLRQTRLLTAMQGDFVAYQEAEYAVAALARTRRPQHLTFQRMATRARQRTARLDTDSALLIHLNPIRMWTRLALPGRDLGEVLFFAAGDRVASVGLDSPAPEIAHLLATRPRTLEECTSRLRPVSREEIAVACRDLADKGLVAFA